MDIDLHKTQQYLDWLKEKLYLNHIAQNTKGRQVRRGEVYLCKFGFGIGSEQSKERPCVIIQYNTANISSPNTIVAPISHTSSGVPVVIPVKTQTDASGKIILDGNVLLGNITCISKARLGSFITILSKDEMLVIDEIVAKSLGILHHHTTLQHMYTDQILHLNKLQEKNRSLQEELSSLRKDLSAVTSLLNKYQFNDVPTLSKYLDANLKLK